MCGSVGKEYIYGVCAVVFPAARHWIVVMMTASCRPREL